MVLEIICKESPVVYGLDVPESMETQLNNNSTWTNISRHDSRRRGRGMSAQRHGNEELIGLHNETSESFHSDSQKEYQKQPTNKLEKNVKQKRTSYNVNYWKWKCIKLNLNVGSWSWSLV